MHLEHAMKKKTIFFLLIGLKQKGGLSLSHSGQLLLIVTKIPIASNQAKIPVTNMSAQGFNIFNIPWLRANDFLSISDKLDDI